MAKIEEYYNFGNNTELTQEELIDILSEMYKDLAVAINKKPDLYQRDSDGLTTDTLLNNGDINLNTSTGAIEFLTDRPTQDSVTWSSSGGQGSIYAFAVVNGNGTLLAGNNITSSYVSSGKYSLTFTTPTANINYAVVATPQKDFLRQYATTIGPKTINKFDVRIKDELDAFANPTTFSVIVVK